jgi:hypothetical protein
MIVGRNFILCLLIRGFRLGLRIHHLLLRAAAEPEPVITTVDHAKSRGWATPFRGSVWHLPRVEARGLHRKVSR